LFLVSRSSNSQLLQTNIKIRIIINNQWIIHTDISKENAIYSCYYWQWYCSNHCSKFAWQKHKFRYCK
jgi:hypothetical protein